jgi:hypothetical protein
MRTKGIPERPWLERRSNVSLDFPMYDAEKRHLGGRVPDSAIDSHLCRQWSHFVVAKVESQREPTIVDGLSNKGAADVNDDDPAVLCMLTIGAFWTM